MLEGDDGTATVDGSQRASKDFSLSSFDIDLDEGDAHVGGHDVVEALDFHRELGR